jgi:AcrR family transcriptional regulator
VVKAGTVTAKHQEIFQAAIKVFREKGYNGASLRDIAQEVGLLKGSLYYYINGKEDLLMQILTFAIDTVSQRLRLIMQQTTDPIEKARQAVINHVLTVIEFSDAVTVFLNEWKFLDQEAHRSYFAKIRDYEQLFQSCLEGASAEVPPCDLRVAGLTILGMCNSVLTWFNPKGYYSPRQIAELYADYAVEGILGLPKIGRTDQSGQTKRGSK